MQFNKGDIVKVNAEYIRAVCLSGRAEDLALARRFRVVTQIGELVHVARDCGFYTKYEKYHESFLMKV